MNRRARQLPSLRSCSRSTSRGQQLLKLLHASNLGNLRRLAVDLITAISHEEKNDLGWVVGPAGTPPMESSSCTYLRGFMSRIDIMVVFFTAKQAFSELGLARSQVGF